jgi:hypothetical protein
MSINIDPTTVTHSFWVLDKLITVNINSVDVLPLANIVTMVNTFGEKYWHQFDAQIVMDRIPFEIRAYIDEYIRAYSRELKIDDVLEEPEKAD